MCYCPSLPPLWRLVVLGVGRNGLPQAVVMQCRVAVRFCAWQLPAPPCVLLERGRSFRGLTVEF